MGKKKKVTYNDLMQRNDFLLSRLMEVERAINYTHSLTVSYIACNKDEDKFKKYLKKEAENGQADGSSSETNRTNQSGNSETIRKSSKSRSSDSKEGNIDKTNSDESINR